MSDDLIAKGKAISERLAAEQRSRNGQAVTDGDPDDEHDAEDRGAELLARLEAALAKYVVFAELHQLVAVVLWIAATHGVSAWQHATRLVIGSPQKRCGKSRLLDVIAATCHSPLLCADATVAAIFRSIPSDGDPPTLVMDETDALFGTKRAAEQNEDLRALLNAGFGRNRPALRCVGPQQVPTAFPTFAMAALAGIGKPPDTITDRAVNIDMQRRSVGDKVSQFRQRRDGPALRGLRDGLAAWVQSNVAKLADAEPDMPVEDREADAWEPLIAIADQAGGDWPKRARAACRALTTSAADDDESLSTLLLNDIRDVFVLGSDSFMASQLLVNELRKVEESPWLDFELNVSKLAFRLKPFGVKPGHNPAKTFRGYSLESLHPVFGRYLRPKPSGRPRYDLGQHEQPEVAESAWRPGPSEGVRTRTVPDGSGREAETAERPNGPGERLIPDGRTGSDGTPAENGTAVRCETCETELIAAASVARGHCEECSLSKHGGSAP